MARRLSIKIAGNAGHGRLRAEMMRALIPLVRAVCDERFNAHGVQATYPFRRTRSLSLTDPFAIS